MNNAAEEQLNVLHVDDNARFLDLFAYTYRKYFNVISVENADKALEVLKKEPVDVIITDYEMSEMNGLDFLKIIQREYPDMPVIFYTGQGNEEVARNAFLAGAFDYHIKELGGFAHREKLVNSVRRAIEKKNAAVSLRESQEIYKNTLENIPMGMLMYTMTTDGTLVITGGNRALDQLIEEDHKHYLGKPIGTIIPNLIADGALEKFLRVATDGIPLKTTKVLFKNSRCLGIFEIYAFQVYLKSIAILLVDITKKRHIEEQLRQSEEEMRFTLENAPAGIVTVNPDTTIRTMNEAFCSILGYDCEELIDKSFAEFTHPDDREKSSEYFRDLIEGRTKTVMFEKRYLKKDKSIVNVIVRSGVVANAEGEPLFLVTVIEDITDRSRAEQSIRESEQLYRSLVEASPNAIIVQDLECRVLKYNRQALKLVGLDPSESVMGRSTLDYLIPEDRERADKVTRYLIETGQDTRERYIIEREDKTRIPVEVIGKLLRDEQGNPRSILIITRDITEQKETEDSLRESEKHLTRAIQGSEEIGWELNLVTGAVRYTPTLPEFLGYELDGTDSSLQFITERLTDPEDREKILEKISKYMEGYTEMLELEHRLLTVSGQWRWMYSRGKIVEWDEQSKPVKIAGTTTDITSRKEEELRAREHVRQMEQCASRVRSGIEDSIQELMTMLSTIQDEPGRTQEYLPRIEERINSIRSTVECIQDNRKDTGV